MKDPIDIVAADIGGTRARFALASVMPGRRPTLSEPVILRGDDHASLALAWKAFAARVERPLPSIASICIAAPLRADTIKLTNSSWVIRQSTLADELGLEQVHLLNDFGAMGHAVAQLRAEETQRVCGPDSPLPENGVITVVGPGTGLGVAILSRDSGRVKVIETEGGHVDFAPLDRLESDIVNRLRERYLRVSTERILSGPGLNNIYSSLAAIEGKAVAPLDDPQLWQTALDGKQPLAAAALQRFCLSYGAIAGDLALAHGAVGVALVGGLTQRLMPRLCESSFELRFRAKGRYENYMAQIPVRLAGHEQMGLLGAAAAYSESLC